MSYERMLDNATTPSFADMQEYVGERGRLWAEFGQRVSEICPVQTKIRFPYGNSDGWSVRYGLEGKSNKHICDTFAEKGAFTVHFRISNTQLDRVYQELSDYSKAVCDNKYPCGDGGWLKYRVLTEENLNDMLIILSAKLSKGIHKQ